MCDPILADDDDNKCWRGGVFPKLRRYKPPLYNFIHLLSITYLFILIRLHHNIWFVLKKSLIEIGKQFVLFKIKILLMYCVQLLTACLTSLCLLFQGTISNRNDSTQHVYNFTQANSEQKNYFEIPYLAIKLQQLVRLIKYSPSNTLSVSDY